MIKRKKCNTYDSYESKTVEIIASANIEGNVLEIIKVLCTGIRYGTYYYKYKGNTSTPCMHIVRTIENLPTETARTLKLITLSKDIIDEIENSLIEIYRP